MMKPEIQAGRSTLLASHPLHKKMMEMLEKLESLFLPTVILLLVGCVTHIKPEISSYDIVDNAEPRVPELTLVRRVNPETQTKKATIYGVERVTEDIGESRFGNFQQDANPQCVIAGIVERIPKAQIVPTVRFWDEVAAPLEKVEISTLFESPMLEQLHEWKIDALVLSHDMEFDLTSFFLEMIAGGIYTAESEETSSAIVMGLRTGRLLESVSVSGTTTTMAGHTLLFVPAYTKETPTSDVCDVVAGRAANAIISNFNSDAPTILVLVTAKNPHFAIDTVDNKTH